METVLSHKRVVGARWHPYPLSPPDKGLALGNPSVRRAIHLYVIESRVRRPAGQGRRDQPQELVLELVRGRVTGHDQVGLVLRQIYWIIRWWPDSQYRPCST